MSINSKADLEASIRELENKKTIQEAALIHQFKVTQESLNPMNIIKNSISRMTAPVMENNFVKKAKGFGETAIDKIKKFGSSLYSRFFKKDSDHQHTD